VSGTDVAETSYTCFAHTRDAITVRLVVRRVRPTPGSQLALFTDWDYHAMVTDRDGDLLEVEAELSRSPSSNRPAWRTCPPGGSWPTPHGSRSR
jgi:hypothetical protein